MKTLQNQLQSIKNQADRMYKNYQDAERREEYGMSRAYFTSYQSYLDAASSMERTILNIKLAESFKADAKAK